MLQLKERRMIELDPDLAKHYLQYDIYPAQRALRPLHVNVLASKMENNLFRHGEIAFVSLNSNSDVMMNGRHVCHAVVETKITVPCVLEKWRAENKQDVSILFRQFEILSKSQKDLVRAEAFSLGLVWPLWVSCIVVSAAGIEKSSTPLYAIVSHEGTERPSPQSLTKDERIALLQQYLEEGDFVYKLLVLPEKPMAHLRRAPCVYMMFQTSRIDKTAAFEFWEHVRDGELLTREMPEMRVREFLLQASSASAHHTTANRRVSNHEFIYRIARAWNAFRSKTPFREHYQRGPVPILK